MDTTAALRLSNLQLISVLEAWFHYPFQRILTDLERRRITLQLTSCFCGLDSVKQVNLLVIFISTKLLNPNWLNRRSAIQ